MLHYELEGSSLGLSDNSKHVKLILPPTLNSWYHLDWTENDSIKLTW